MFIVAIHAGKTASTATVPRRGVGEGKGCHFNSRFAAAFKMIAYRQGSKAVLLCGPGEQGSFQRVCAVWASFVNIFVYMFYVEVGKYNLETGIVSERCV